ncbi:MAG: SDR family NAD(P)-dependent oxidoreductase [Ignavibacteriaceae bacterium]|nr:SDR family NAD(P)-dependent oxidoreductase [Ignavibacteriaceae bacterium]
MVASEKVVWVTGASSGIGKSLTKQFYANNISILATARNIEKLKELESQLKAKFPTSNSNLIVAKCNVTNLSEIDSLFDNIVDVSKISCLINNAGITSFKKINDNSIDEVNSIIQTNLIGSIYTIKKILPSLISKNEGMIINILSVVTKKVFLNSGIYTASKLGLMGFLNVLREEVRRNNIRIVNVIPGATETSIWSSDMLNKYSDRMMKPDDIAKIIVDYFMNQSSPVIEEIVLRPIGGDL